MKHKFLKYVETYHAIDEPNTATWWHTSDWLPVEHKYDDNKLLELGLKTDLP